MASEPFHRRNHCVQAGTVIREEAPESLRHFVVSAADQCDIPPKEMLKLISGVVHTFRDDSISYGEEIERRIRECEWFYVYTIIEQMDEWLRFADEYNPPEEGFVRHEALPADRSKGFTTEVNAFFEDNRIGWQLVSGEIVTRCDEAFENTMKTAKSVLKKNTMPTAAEHLEFAVSALSARPEPNTSGAVAHATNAVECVLGEITGEKTALGDHLKKKPAIFHPALKKGLEGIYGYASDEGARHGKEGTKPAREEAEFVLATCAAVCTLLARKHLK
jgi:hypothetical protein